MATLTARISRLEDLEAIRQLSSKYARAIDDRDYEALLSLFAPDAVFGGTSDGAISLTGAENIVDSLRKRLNNSKPTYHYVHEVLVMLDAQDPDLASGVASTHAEVKAGQDTVRTAVRYLDRYRSRKGRWQFQARLLTFPML
jgi:uncharacterized protein (TIGR02246 family)